MNGVEAVESERVRRLPHDAAFRDAEHVSPAPPAGAAVADDIDWLRADRDHARNTAEELSAACLRAFDTSHSERARGNEAASAERGGGVVAALRKAVAKFLGRAHGAFPERRPIAPGSVCYAPLTPSACVVRLAAPRLVPCSGIEIRLTALSTDRTRTFAVECRVGHGGCAPAGEQSVPLEGVDEPFLAVRLLAGTPAVVWCGPEAALPGPEVLLHLRRLRGEPCLVKIEIGAGQDIAAARGGPPSVSSSGTSAHEPSSLALPPAVAVDAARNAPRHTLWRAQELAHFWSLDAVIRFAEREADEAERPAVDLLCANASIASDADWLAYVNRYLASSRLTALELREGSAARFHRLRTGPVADVETGPVVSVIMPAFNAVRTLRTAVASIRAQSWHSLELIIVDDASADGTYELALSLAHGDGRIRVMRNPENVGPYVSKNMALRIASGRWITVHDADDWAHPQRIELQAGLMQRLGDRCVATLAGMLRMTEEGRFSGLTRQGRTSFDGALRDAPTSCMIESRFFKDRLGHWDSVRFGADGELIERLEAAAGDRFMRLPVASSLYLDSDASITHDPRNGISSIAGISSARRCYRDAWRQWHRLVGRQGAFMMSQDGERPFQAPDGMAVSPARIRRVAAAHAASS